MGSIYWTLSKKKIESFPPLKTGHYETLTELNLFGNIVLDQGNPSEYVILMIPLGILHGNSVLAKKPLETPSSSLLLCLDFEQLRFYANDQLPVCSRWTMKTILRKKYFPSLMKNRSSSLPLCLDFEVHLVRLDWTNEFIWTGLQIITFPVLVEGLTTK